MGDKSLLYQLDISIFDENEIHQLRLQDIDIFVIDRYTLKGILTLVIID